MVEIKQINHPSFPDWLKVETARDNEISQLAKQGLPIILPWGKRKIRLGTGYKSSLQSTKETPFLKESPFILSDLYTMPKILLREGGTDSKFKSVNTSRVFETGDHLSLGLGVGVGLPFLASVSVKGQFDQHVHENRDSDKTSIRATVKCGTVQLGRNPALTREGKIAIKYNGGYQAFCDKYGDYFVAGYRPGGETGLLASSSSFRREKIDKFSISVTVEVLFFSASTTYAKELENKSFGRSFKLLGCDTLEGRNWDMQSDNDGVPAQQEQSKQIILRSQCILERGLEILNSLNFKEDQELTWEQCDRLAELGIVAELVLLPISSIRDVACWTLEDNII